MRIVVVGPVYPFRGGIAHHTTMLVRALAAKHQVQVISFRRQYPRWLYPGQSDRDPSQQTLLVDAEYILDPFYPWTWQQSANWIVQYKPDAVVIQWWTTFWAPALATFACLLRRSSIGPLYLVHNVLPHEVRLGDVWLSRWGLRWGKGYIVPSQNDLRRLNTLVPGRPIKIAPHPLYDMFAAQSPTRQEARQSLGLAESTPVLLFFGLVREYKGLRYLLEALPLIRAELADIHLLIVGEFWDDYKSYLTQIERLGIEQNVVIINKYVPNEEVPVFFSAADVVVLPYTDVTQSGVAQLAFGFGVPIISTQVGSLAETVTEGQTGLLVPPRNPEALAEAVLRYFREELKLNMAAAIHETRVKFGWDNLVTLIEELAI